MTRPLVVSRQMSKTLDSDFPERLRQAAEKSKIPYRQSPLADYLGVQKQNVDSWMKGGLPRADQIFKMADKFKVDARWLATGVPANEKNVYDVEHKKQEKIVAVIKALLLTDDQGLEEIVAAVQALSEGVATNGRQRGRHRRSR